MYSEKNSGKLYDVEIHITFFKEYFEIDSCRIKEEDCRRKSQQYYLTKAKNPDIFRHDNQQDLLAEIEKQLESGRDVRIRFTDVTPDRVSRKQLLRLQTLRDRPDVRVHLAGMPGIKR